MSFDNDPPNPPPLPPRLRPPPPVHHPIYDSFMLRHPPESPPAYDVDLEVQRRLRALMRRESEKGGFGGSEVSTRHGTILIAHEDLLWAAKRNGGHEFKPELPPRSSDQKDGELDEVFTDYLSGWRLTSLITAITTACFVVLLDTSIIVTAIPKITSEFHSLGDVGWYGSAYNLASAAVQPMAGKFYTYFRTKWVFLGFFFVFAIGSLVCAVAQSSDILIAGRAIAGVGAAGIQNGAYIIVAAAAPLERQPSLMGMIMGGCQIGILAGPLIGGALTQYSSWRWCFYINLPIGAIGAAMIMFVTIPDRRKTRDYQVFRDIVPHLDIPGFIIFAPASIMLLLALEWGGNEYPWGSSQVIGLIVGGLIITGVFIYWEKRMGEQAMIPIPLIKKREIWSASLASMFLFTTIYLAAYYMPIYFQAVKDASPVRSGVNMLPIMFTQLLFAVVSGFLAQKVGFYLPFAVLCAIVISIGNGLFATLTPSTSTATWAGYMILLGFGRGMGMQMPVIAIQANTPQHYMAITTAFMTFAQTFGGAVFLAVGNAIFNNKLENELKERVPQLDSQQIIDAGARSVRLVVSGGQDLSQVLMAYCKAANSVYFLAVTASLLMLLFSFMIGFKDIRKKKDSGRADL